jgi:hypothetical protein
VKHFVPSVANGYRNKNINPKTEMIVMIFYMIKKILVSTFIFLMLV